MVGVGVHSHHDEAVRTAVRRLLMTSLETSTVRPAPVCLLLDTHRNGESTRLHQTRRRVNQCTRDWVEGVD